MVSEYLTGGITSKFAVTVIVLVTVTVVEALDGFATVPAQPVKRYPVAGVAVIFTTVFSLYVCDPTAGDVVPQPALFTAIVRVYCVGGITSKLAVMDILLLTITVVVALDELVTVPVQPVKR